MDDAGGLGLPEVLGGQIGCADLSASDTKLKYDKNADDKTDVEIGRQIDMAEPKRAPLLLTGEHRDIRVDVNSLLANGNAWLETPNSIFSGRCPADLIGTPDEALLRETLRSAIYSGMA